ncbi:hypothetical protein [Cupriavidus sp. YR651]|nr:hypothetical protein [Cupriavidus sp. YR651]
MWIAFDVAEASAGIKGGSTVSMAVSLTATPPAPGRPCPSAEATPR